MNARRPERFHRQRGGERRVDSSRQPDDQALGAGLLDAVAQEVRQRVDGEVGVQAQARGDLFAADHGALTPRVP